MLTSVNVIFFSPDNRAEFELDVEPFSGVETNDSGRSLTIRHIAGPRDNPTSSDARHFLSLKQLIALRDLLNEKLPPPQFAELAALKEEAKHAAIEKDLAS